MIDIRELYRAPNGTREHLEYEIETEDFENLDLSGALTVKFDLLRVQEGIMLSITELKAKMKGSCVLCQKEIDVDVETNEGEWLFYEERPKDYDDENEFLFIDKDEFEIDPLDPIRQEVFLNMTDSPRCPVRCASFDQESKGVKALSNLKDLFNENNGK